MHHDFCDIQKRPWITDTKYDPSDNWIGADIWSSSVVNTTFELHTQAWICPSGNLIPNINETSNQTKHQR